MSDFERRAVQRIVDQAAAAGVQVPAEVIDVLARLDHTTSHAARAWADQHRDEADWPVGCCIGNDMYGPERCTCWTPVFELEQQLPRPPERAEDLTVRTRMCDDCAFRKGSQERAADFLEEELFGLAEARKPFYCHDGMRRPAYWLHPDGRRIEGSTADWQPPIVAGIPYRADGRPGMLCAGWAARAARADPVPP
jgi:hypothetical protein